MMRKRTLVLMFAILTVTLVAFVSKASMAQDTNAKPADTKTQKAAPAPGLVGPGNPVPGNPNFDPQVMRQRMAERLKENLGASDDEWKILEPRIEKVIELQRRTRGGMMGMMGMRGGRRGGNGMGPGPQGMGPRFQISPEAEALRTAVDSTDAKPEDIKAKLKAYREAKAKDEAALDQARKELQKVLSVKQEASLVLMGILD